MSQEELKKQFIEYAKYNLNNDTIIIVAYELLENISNDLYENGYIEQSDKLAIACLKIKEVVEQ